ncbi:TRAP transporter large permease [Lacibacterium aquatile]|uniref:TRAP transporter large permease protein n=1 Tax=Lacibacterium aquatile TaxID=1168082 RepID=A0ABW5DNB0_9PROT
MIFFAILALVIVVLLSGLPVFTGLGMVGGGLMLASEGRLAGLSEIIFGELNSYLLLAIPMFTLMAHIMVKGRIVDDLFATAHTLVRHLPGGLGIATVIACATFSAVSGSSVATALTIGAVAIPQMLRYGYKPHVAYGVVGGGGTLGILIPPSGPMVLYGVVSDTSIGALYMAGVIPGLLVTAIFSVFCLLQDRFSDQPTQREERASWSEMLQALRRSLWALTLPTFVLVGMYAGVFTATEAAAVGAMAALVVAVLVYRSFGLKELWQAALDSARTTAMLMLILAAAGVFGHVLTTLRIPQEITALITGLGVGVIGFLTALMGLIFILGMFLETIAIIMITTPVVLPVMQQMQIDPVWYGILLVINLELALITPPVGMNLFTIKAITQAPISQIVRGVVPYAVLLVLSLGLVMAFPDIALWLPRTMAE